MRGDPALKIYRLTENREQFLSDLKTLRIEITFFLSKPVIKSTGSPSLQFVLTVALRDLYIP